MVLNCSGMWLKRGSTDKSRIIALQEELNSKGISRLAIKGVLAVDGDYGKVTETVVKYAQDELLGVTVDGIVGPETCKALNNYRTTGTSPWTRIYYTRDSQDTNYSCGPSSLKMALSVYGLYYDEATLIRLVNAKPRVGTENANIVNAVNQLGKGLRAWNETFKSWETLRDYLAKGWPVILRVASWVTPGGEHFVLLAGLNLLEGKVELGDSSNGGFRVTTTTDLRERIMKVSSGSVIVISK